MFGPQFPVGGLDINFGVETAKKNRRLLFSIVGFHVSAQATVNRRSVKLYPL